MKIKQLKEKTIKGFIDFLPKLSIEAIPGLQDIINDIKNKTITDIEITQAGGQEGETLEGVDIYLIYAGSRAGKLIGISNATTTVDGCMSHEDKAKLDAIPKTYLPLSGGTLTGNLYVTTISGDRNGASYTNVASIQSYDQDKSMTPEVWSTDGNTIPLNKANGIPTLNSNGKIDEYKIDDLSSRYVASGDGTIYTRNYKHYGYTYLYINGSDNKIGAGGIISVTKTVNEGITEETINIDGRTGIIAAEGFKSKSEPNKDEVWTCNGSSANIRSLIAATAVYVHGSIVESIAESINLAVTIEDPDAIIFNKATGSFVAKKDNAYYRYWNNIDNLLISSSDKYGFLIPKRGIVPYHKQLYIFTNDNYNIYVADNTGSVPVLDKLNIN